jgi:hypothetical protein
LALAIERFSNRLRIVSCVLQAQEAKFLHPAKLAYPGVISAFVQKQKPGAKRLFNQLLRLVRDYPKAEGFGP